MKILTFNLWHGMRRSRFGLASLEPAGRRALRLRGFLSLAREAEADLIFLQEANPTPEVARKVAAELGMDEIHQVCNAGIKLPLGVPLSFRSGVILLARRGMGLFRLAAIKLPGSGWGWCGDRFSFQVQEHRYALFGRVEWQGTSLILAVTHLHQTRPLNREAVRRIRQAAQEERIPLRLCTRLLAGYEERVTRRRRQIQTVLSHLERLAPAGPAILAGDFNAEPDSVEIRDLVHRRGFIDTYAQAGPPPGYTWDPERNRNSPLSSGAFLKRNLYPHEIRVLLEAQDMRPGRLDYVFLNPWFTVEQVLSSELFATRPLPGGLFCSDHFGVTATLRFGPHPGEVAFVPKHAAALRDKAASDPGGDSA